MFLVLINQLVNFDGLIAANATGNLENAFDVAEKDLDIIRLLDAKGKEERREIRQTYQGKKNGAAP